MTRRCSRVIGAVAIGVLLVGCVRPTTLADTEYMTDYLPYATTVDLVAAADLIVRGAVVSTRVETSVPAVSTETDPTLNPQAGLDPAELEGPDPLVTTIATVRVTDVISGALDPGKEIEVSQLGGRLDGVQYTEHGATLLTRGDTEYVLVLRRTPASRYLPLNPAQGMYRVATSGELTAVSTEHPLPIKDIDDLRAALARP